MADKINNGGPAFPTHATGLGLGSGMTLRDWFAGQALAGLCAYSGPAGVGQAEDRSWLAYVVADAMIAARKQEAL